MVRLEKQPDAEVRAEMEKLVGGKSLCQIGQTLLDAIEPDKVEAAAQFLAASEAGCGGSGDEPLEPTPVQVEEARESIVNRPPLRLRAIPLRGSGSSIFYSIGEVIASYKF